MVCLKNVSNIDQAQLQMHEVIGDLHKEQEMSPTFAGIDISCV
jgi:hypothetical protein